MTLIPNCAGHAVMSFGFDTFGLIQSVRQLEMLAKARLAERRKAACEVDPMLVQLARFGVCTCSCHFNANTAHTGEACCPNATIAK
jgi:hypothetical protein